MTDLAREASSLRKAAWHVRDQWRLSVHRALERQLPGFRQDVVHTDHPHGLAAAVVSAASGCEVPHAHTVNDPNVLCSRMTMIADGRFRGGRRLSCRPSGSSDPRFFRRSPNRLTAHFDYFWTMHLGGVVPTEQARDDPPEHDAGYGATAAGQPARPNRRVPGCARSAQRRADAARGLSVTAVRLRIAGSDPLEETSRPQASSNPGIELAWLVLDEAKDDFLNIRDVLVIPSQYAQNASLVAVEAAVRGLPAVVSYRRGLPETAEASAFRTGDQGGLFEALRRLVAEPSELVGRSRRLLESSERFLWGNRVRGVEGTPREIVR